MSEERKLVTILFADVTNSTSLGESLDLEDMRALMGRYYEHAREVVTSYGGTLEKFIGDAVMAVFGLPTAHDDDAERALAAALALNATTRQDTLLGEAFQLRMGINTGEVMATSDTSRSDFLVTGDAVNVAARLEQNANPGEIIASERTAQAARMAFLFEEPREIKVKGKQLPLRIFPLKEKRAQREVERPPLVGRKQDILQLEVLRERTLEEERPQLVSIIAPAGTGKTRLLEEFLSRLPAEEGFQVATARCLPYGQTLTYWPLQGLLYELLGAEVTKERVAASFMRGKYSTDDANRLANYVLATLGIEDEGAGNTERELIFSAWRLLIESLAGEAPRIILFEDLHWASNSLLDLIEHITHIRIQATLLLISLSRPELLDRRPNWGGGRQNFTSLSLQPLSIKQTGELIKKLVADLPAEVNQRIIESSGGNPFFALELLRGLAERSMMGQSATLEALPDTVHAAVLARLDLLTRIERDVLQVASVASRVFSLSLLASVLREYSEDAIHSALDGLLVRDMITSVQGQNYAFRHILILDVTYGTLSRAERIRQHKAIAAYLFAKAEDAHLDEQVELLAYHYHKVVQLAYISAVPQKVEVETGRAMKFLTRAGELASHVGAFAEAHGYFQSAISLADDTGKLALYEKLGDNLGWGWGEQIFGAYQKALDVWRHLNDAQPLTGARLIRKSVISDTRLSMNDRTKLDAASAEKLRQEGLRLAELAADEDELWRVRSTLLFMRAELQDLSYQEIRALMDARELQKLTRESAAYFEQRQDWEALSEVLDGYSMWQLLAAENAEGLATVKQRLQIEKLSFRERNDAIGMYVVFCITLGEYNAAIDLILETLNNLRAGEPIEPFTGTISNVLGAAYLSGRWSEVPRLQKALQEAEARVSLIENTPVLMALASGQMAILALALAREDRASADAAEALLHRLVPTSSSTSIFSMAAIYRDEDFSNFNPASTADDTIGALIMFYTEHGLCPPLELMQREERMQVDVTVWARKIAQALLDMDTTALALAIDQAEAHQIIVHAARMRIVLAKLTGDRSQLVRARTVLEPLEDRLFLRKLQEVDEMLQGTEHL